MRRAARGWKASQILAAVRVPGGGTRRRGRARCGTAGRRAWRRTRPWSAPTTGRARGFPRTLTCASAPASWPRPRSSTAQCRHGPPPPPLRQHPRLFALREWRIRLCRGDTAGQEILVARRQLRLSAAHLSALVQGLEPRGRGGMRWWASAAPHAAAASRRRGRGRGQVPAILGDVEDPVAATIGGVTCLAALAAYCAYQVSARTRTPPPPGCTLPLPPARS